MKLESGAEEGWVLFDVQRGIVTRSSGTRQVTGKIADATGETRAENVMRVNHSTEGK